MLAWRQCTDLSGPVDPITNRLLPLLYCNMHTLGYQGSEMPHLKGLYRNAWYRNNLLFRGLAPLLDELSGAGFRLLFLKGLPLAQSYYSRPASRPMSDIDIMIPADQATTIVDYMDGRGYERHASLTQGGIVHRHSISYLHEDHELDIHWLLLRDCGDPKLAHDMWSKAVPFDCRGLHAWTTAPADTLFHLISHGLRWNPEPSIRWIPDAWMVINNHDSDLDWSRILYLCQQYAFSERIHSGLAFLQEELAAPVPGFLLDALKASRTTLVERMERTYIFKENVSLYAHPLGKVWMTFVDYQSSGERRKYLPRVLGISDFISVRWGTGNRRTLIKSTLSGIWRRIKNRLLLLAKKVHEAGSDNAI